MRDELRVWPAGSNRVGMHLPRLIVGLMVHGDAAELHVLKDQICRAGLIAVSRGAFG